MNWKRGLLRGWIVLAGIWVVLIGIVFWSGVFPSGNSTFYYSAVENQLGESYFGFSNRASFEKGESTQLDFPERRVRIVFEISEGAGIILPATKEETAKYESTCTKSADGKHCAATLVAGPVPLSTARGRADFIAILDRAESMRQAQRLSAFGHLALTAAGVPLVVLVLGMLILWIVRGFRNESRV